MAPAAGQRTLNLVPLQVPLDEWPVALPVPLLVDEPGERRLQLDSDLVPRSPPELTGLTVAHRSVSRRAVELERVPDLEQRPRSFLEADDARELDDVDAHLEELVDNVARRPEDVNRGFCDAL